MPEDKPSANVRDMLVHTLAHISFSFSNSDPTLVFIQASHCCALGLTPRWD